MVRTAFQRQFQPFCNRIRGHDRAAPQPQQHSKNQPDRTLPLHQNHVAGPGIALRYRFDTGVHRLHESRRVKRDAIGNLLHASLHDPGHHPDILSEAPPGGLKTSGYPHLLIDRTLRV